MEKMINEIQQRVNAEKLLFDDKKEYSNEELKFITQTCLKILTEEGCYMSILKKHVSKLLKAYKNYDGEDLVEEINLLGIEVERMLSKSNEEILLEEQGAKFLYHQFIGIPKQETYYDFIKTRIMDVGEVRSILDCKFAYEFYGNNTNFLLTNNFLFLFYPKLYTQEDLNQLNTIAYDRNKNNFENKEEYLEFKRASNATKKLIKHHEKRNNVKIKNLKN